MGLSAKPYPSFEIFRKDFLSSTSCLSRCSFLSRILSSIRARNHDVCTSRNLWLCLAVLRTNSSIKSSLLFSHWVALLLSELHIKGIWNLTTAPVRVLDIMISGNDDVSFHVSTLSPDQSASFYRLARLCRSLRTPPPLPFPLPLWEQRWWLTWCSECNHLKLSTRSRDLPVGT